MFIDSHAHLDGPKFETDRDAVLERAWKAQLEAILCIGSGTGPGDWDCAIKVAEQDARLHATVGVHPHEANIPTDADFVALARLAKHEKVVGWGEIGLDYFYDHSPRDVQLQVFVRQMELAAEAELPIIIHCRPSNHSEDAWQDTFRLIREHWSGRPGVFHCFTGDERLMATALELRFHISFSGAVTFPKAEGIQRAAKSCPADRMLIETDSPFLAPAPYRGKRNEPAFVVQTAEFIAKLRGDNVRTVGERTTENFKRLFTKVPSS